MGLQRISKHLWPVVVLTLLGLAAFVAMQASTTEPALDRELQITRVSFNSETSVVIDSLTTADRKVYLNEDGTYTAQLSSGPARIPDGSGGWDEIDLQLQPGQDGKLRPLVSPTEVSVAANTSTNTLASLGVGDDEISLTTLGISGAIPFVPSEEGSLPGATFPSARAGGVDVSVAPLTVGIKTAYKVPTLAGVAGLTETLRLPEGWSARQAGTAIELLDEAGSILARWQGGSATDSAVPPWEGEVVLSLLSSVGREVTARVELSNDWELDPARVYPITIDPQVVKQTSDPNGIDTYVQNTYPGSHSTEGDIRIGTWDGGYTNARSLVIFDMSSVAGAEVSDARLRMYEYHSFSCTEAIFTAKRITSG